MSVSISHIYRSVAVFTKRHQRLVWIGFFVAVWLAASYIFFKRFPNNLLYPNFFAEDGQHFARNVMEHGSLGSFIQKFNGYYIFGIYLLTNIGFVVNDLLFGGQFFMLPSAFAIVSYGFLGLCCALPILLLKRFIRWPYLLAAALLMAFLPMPSFDYGTIGTIGNLKFAFAYIALLLLAYRTALPRNAKRIVVIDIGLLFCAYTTAGVYLLLPFLLLCDGLRPRQLLRRAAWHETFRLRNIALWSGLVLLAVAAIQALIVAVQGTPELTGYLDEPYQVAKTIELFIARPYLYPFVNVAYRHLNDILVSIIFVIGLGLVYRFGNKRNRQLYFLAIWAVFATTAVFVFNRTGTSVYYDHYRTSGFDNFFYAQNFMAIIIGVLLLQDLVRRFRIYRAAYVALGIVAILLIAQFRTNASYAPNDFMQYQIGTIQQQAQALCRYKTDDAVTFSVYPFTFLTMTEPRDRLCTDELAAYDSRLQDFGLDTSQNLAFDIGPGTPSFTQTFKAGQDDLQGISVYLSTYFQTFLNDYQFELRDGSCQTVIRSVAMPDRIRDNSYRLVSFDPVANSKDTTYCFTIKPTADSAQKLALQLSRVDVYKTGELHLNDRPQIRDVVFEAVY